MKKLFLSLVFLFLFIIYFFSYPSKTIATWNKYPSNPVIPYGTPGQFDSVNAGTPSVVRNNDYLLMLYEGNNGSNWFIGVATASSDTAWTKLGPIILNNPGSPNSHDPSILFEDGIYKMWYGNSPSNFFNMHINYSTSPDGINWSDPVTVLNPSLYWENNRGISTPTVVHDSSGYKIWYAGNSLVNGQDTWRIGFAYSSDGINWTKHPDPVLYPTAQWEGGGATSPIVLYNNGVYEMWYTSDGGIGHAWSLDGIDWIKDPENPVLVKGSGIDFDSNHAGGNTVIRENGLDKTWYTGINSGGRWQIGYAEKGTEVPPITPVPTEIPSPTEVPAPNKVIFIPGLGASWNQGDLFSCNLSQSGSWTLAPYVNVYDRIIQTFTQNAGLQLNKDFYVYGFDWRQSMVTAGSKLKDFIDSIQSNGKVDIVSHSLGGLVARSYILQNPDDHKVDKFVSIGTPHRGTPLAYPIWENGEIWVDNFVEKVGINILINYCRTKVGNPIATKRQTVQALSPSIRDILPTFDFLKKNGQLVTDPLIEGENPWLSGNPFPSPFYGSSVLTIAGVGKKTLETIDVKNPSNADTLLGNWKDGKPKKKNNSELGDGTVLTESSTLNGASGAQFNLNHIGLVQNAQSIQEALNFLGYAGVTAVTEKVVPELSVSSSFSVTWDRAGTMTLRTLKNEQIQSNNEGILTYYSDKASKYYLTLDPAVNGVYSIGYSQLGKSEVWKQFTVNMKAGQEKTFALNYNPKNPTKSSLVLR